MALLKNFYLPHYEMHDCEMHNPPMKYICIFIQLLWQKLLIFGKIQGGHWDDIIIKSLINNGYNCWYINHFNIWSINF